MPVPPTAALTPTAAPGVALVVALVLLALVPLALVLLAPPDCVAVPEVDGDVVVDVVVVFCTIM